MNNLARAATTAGLAVAFGIIAMPSASAAGHEAAGATKSKSSATSATSKAAVKKAAEKQAAAALANRPVTINVYYVMADGRVISEQGPGDVAAHALENTRGAIDMQSQNESIRTGDLRAEGQKNSPATFEVEGSEQDQGEVS